MLKDSFETQFDVDLTSDSIHIKRKKKANRVLVVLLGFLMLVFGYFGVQFSLIFGGSNIFFFLVLELILAAIIWVNIKNHIYPVLELDLKNMTAVKKPFLGFMKEKHIQLKDVKGIDFLVKPVGGYASPFEEGNTDYRKRIVLNTQKGDFTIFSFINRSEELEESARAMIKKINGMLSATSL